MSGSAGSSITITVQNSPTNVSVDDGRNNVVQVLTAAPPQVVQVGYTAPNNRLGLLGDVDVLNAVDGNALIFEGASGKWRASDPLDATLTDGGNF